MSKLEEVRNRRIHLEASVSTLDREINKKRDEITKKKADLEKLEKVSSFFKSYVEAKAVEPINHIQEVVTKGLQSIFDEDISVEIKSEYKRGKVEYKIEITHNDVTGSGEDHAGGILAVTSVIFRLIINYLAGNRRFMIFDETLLPISQQYQRKVSEFLHTLCEQTGYTVIVIYPKKKEVEEIEFAADKVYEVVKRNGHTEYVETD